MAEKPHSTALAKWASAKGATKPAPDHPQRLHLHRLEKPAASLEAWLDAGLRCDADEGKDSVNGKTMLPSGYEGCSDDTVLVEATQPGVLMWPVRFDVGDLSADDENKPWTLYHYTHKVSFAKFAKDLADLDQSVAQAELSRLVYDHLFEDFREREPEATASHTKRDVELCSIEPALFKSKKEIRKVLFGGEKRTGFTPNGHYWSEFGDYCIAVRVPGASCRLLGGMDRKGQIMVGVSKEIIDALCLRGEAQLEMRRLRHDRAVREQERLGHQAKSGCLSFLFGGTGKPSYDDYEEDFDQKKQELVAGQDVINRPKREVGHRQKQMRRKWIKEHFANVTVREEQQKASANKVGAGGAGKQLSLGMVGRGATSILVDSAETKKDKAEANRASNLFKDYHEKADGKKELVRGSLMRMKTRRSTRMNQAA